MARDKQQIPVMLRSTTTLQQPSTDTSERQGHANRNRMPRGLFLLGFPKSDSPGLGRSCTRKSPQTTELTTTGPAALIVRWVLEKSHVTISNFWWHSTVNFSRSIFGGPSMRSLPQLIAQDQKHPMTQRKIVGSLELARPIPSILRKERTHDLQASPRCTLS